MPILTIEGTNINYVREGNGGQPMFLLHSLGGSAEMWRRTIDELKIDFTIIAPDARGHGRSEANGDITVERFARDAIAIADALSIESYGVVGLSMGGQAAMHVALEDSSRVTFLVAADTSLGAASKNTARLAEARERIQSIGVSAFAAEYTKSRLMPHTSEVEVDRFAAMVMDTLPTIYVEQLASIIAQDLRKHVNNIKCPTLIVVGSDDVSTPPSAAQALCQSIRGAELQVIDAANHLSNIDQPAAFNAAIRSFAKKATSS